MKHKKLVERIKRGNPSIKILIKRRTFFNVNDIIELNTSELNH